MADGTKVNVKNTFIEMEEEDSEDDANNKRTRAKTDDPKYYEPRKVSSSIAQEPITEYQSELQRVAHHGLGLPAPGLEEAAGLDGAVAAATAAEIAGWSAEMQSHWGAMSLSMPGFLGAPLWNADLNGFEAGSPWYPFAISQQGMLPFGYPPHWGEYGATPDAVAGSRQRGSRGQKPQRTAGKKSAEGSQKAKGGSSSAAVSSTIEHREGTQTTVMLRNIPNRYDQDMLLGLLDERGFKTKYDFVYLPMDFRNKVNLGYAFVNFTSHEDAMKLTNMMRDFQQWKFDSQKVCEVSWAHPHQGKDEHVERYRNSPVMHESMPEAFKPMIFENGQKVPFPQPTKAIRAPKMRPAGHERNGGATSPSAAPVEGSAAAGAEAAATGSA